MLVLCFGSGQSWHALLACPLASILFRVVPPPWSPCVVQEILVDPVFRSHLRGIIPAAGRGTRTRSGGFAPTSDSFQVRAHRVSVAQAPTHTHSSHARIVHARIWLARPAFGHAAPPCPECRCRAARTAGAVEGVPNPPFCSISLWPAEVLHRSTHTFPHCSATKKCSHVSRVFLGLLDTASLEKNNVSRCACELNARQSRALKPSC